MEVFIYIDCPLDRCILLEYELERSGIKVLRNRVKNERFAEITIRGNLSDLGNIRCIVNNVDDSVNNK